MIKPITYYIDTPNIRSFCQVYGDYAQNLGQADKIFLVATIAAYAAFVTTAMPDDDEIPSEVYRACQLPTLPSGQCRLAKYLASLGLRYAW